MFVSVSSLKINQGLGHSDILDHPHGDGKDGLCVTSFYGENHLNSPRSGRQESIFFFFILFRFCVETL